MLWIKDNFLKVWKVEVKEKFVQATVSTGSKQQDGTYKNSSWNVKFLGKAKTQAEQLKEGDTVIPKSGAVENIWDKEKQRSWLTVLIFDFEIQNNNNFVPVNDEDDDLPF